jgi:hypothetical protein
VLKQTSWATSAMSPEVEMHIVSQSAEATENTTNNSTDKQKEANTHTAWTSAEELANAIFPSNLEADATHASNVHVGLLNHKLEIERLKQSFAELNTSNGSLEENHVHKGLLNHRQEIQDSKESVADIMAKTSVHSDHVHLDHVHNGLLDHKVEIERLQKSVLLDHKVEIERLQKSVAELTTKSILLSAKGARTNGKENVSSQQNRQMDHAHEALLQHKKFICEHENSIERHKEGLLLHKQEIKYLAAKIDSLESKQKDLLHHENSVECQNKGLLLQNQEIKSLTAKIATLESKHSALESKHSALSNKH